MRLYHLISAEYGLMALRKRRLRASRLTALNDPFELIGVDVSDPDVRRAMHAYKDKISITKGIHCFSRSWSNPVLWSHYADRHRGICLGFDVDDELTIRVTYERERLNPAELWKGNEEQQQDFMQRILSTKFSHWSYESEVRVFVELAAPDQDTGFHFTDFSPRLALREVIVGGECDLTRAVLLEAVAEHSPSVRFFKARPAFKKFKVVRNRDERSWS
jgi:hypothetical protein